MKICIFTDIHGNITSFREFVKTKDFLEADKRIYLGDTVMCCAHPNECIELLTQYDCINLLGNNDSYIINNIEQEDSEKFKQIIFNRNLVTEKNKEILRSFEKEFYLNVDGIKLYFTHYPWKDDVNCHYVIQEKTLEKRQELFKNIDADYIFFGHEHLPTIFEDDKKKYICVGSLCLSQPCLYLMVNIENGNVEIQEKNFPQNFDSEIETIKNSSLPNICKESIIERLIKIDNHENY